MMDNKLITMTFKIDQEVYEQASEACERLGTTIEIMAESFAKFCIIPENRPLLEAFLMKGKAPAKAGAKEEIDRLVLERVYAIAIKQT